MKEVVGELCDNRCLPILYTLYIIYRGGLRKKKRDGITRLIFFVYVGWTIAITITLASSFAPRCQVESTISQG